MSSRRDFLSSIGWVFAGLGGAWLLRDHVFWPPPDVTHAPTPTWLPFATRRAGLVTLEVELAGRRVTALLDSGAQYSAVDRAYVEAARLPLALAPPMVASGIGGGAQIGRRARLRVVAGGTLLDGVNAAVLELGPLAQAAGRPVPLILGHDVLQAVIADVDFPRRRLRLVERAGFVPPPDVLSAPVRRNGRSVAADITVEGVSLEVVVDTGASGVLSLAADVAQAAGLLDRPSRPTSSVVLGGVAPSVVVEVASLTFGDLTLTDVDVQVFAASRLPGFPKGLLGTGAFDDRRILLDQGGGRLYMSPIDAAA